MKIVCMFLVIAVLTGAAARAVSPDEALVRLREGNARYAAGESSSSKPTAARRVETAQSQQPYAIIIGCADSRVPPEMVFDAGIGDLFVIRTAGNVSDDHMLGSIEYAVDHLGTTLIVVLGHERCGAVTAALEAPHASGHIDSIVTDIRPAVEATASVPDDEHLNAAIADNARRIARLIRERGDFGEHGNELNIVPAVYDLDTGLISWLAD